MKASYAIVNMKVRDVMFSCVKAYKLRVVYEGRHGDERG